MKFRVSVEKRMYCTGTVTVNCGDADQAVRLVKNRIDLGQLQATAVEWDDPRYEDFSFDATGDVDEEGVR